MFNTVYTAMVYGGLAVSTVFVVGWLTLFVRGQVNPERVPYSALSIIDFIGLPILCVIAFALTAFGIHTHGVLPSPTLTNYAQRLVVFGALDLLVLLRLLRFVAAFRASESPAPLGAPKPRPLDRDGAGTAS